MTDQPRRKPWAADDGGNRAVRLPPDWPKRRAAVMKRDEGRCYICGGDGADQVDHVVPVAWGGTDDLINLRPVHAKPCHEEKSKREAAEGRRRSQNRRFRPKEPHPGLRHPEQS